MTDGVKEWLSSNTVWPPNRFTDALLTSTSSPSISSGPSSGRFLHLFVYRSILPLNTSRNQLLDWSRRGRHTNYPAFHLTLSILIPSNSYAVISFSLKDSQSMTHLLLQSSFHSIHLGFLSVLITTASPVTRNPSYSGGRLDYLDTPTNIIPDKSAPLPVIQVVGPNSLMMWPFSAYLHVTHSSLRIPLPLQYSSVELNSVCQPVLENKQIWACYRDRYS